MGAAYEKSIPSEAFKAVHTNGTGIATEDSININAQSYFRAGACHLN